MKEKTRVLVVDDSAVVRQRLKQILSSDPEIEIMGTAADPFIAVSKISSEVPDVITLDVEMPRMDGITFLRKIMSQHPIPVVIVSSLTSQGTETALKAIEYGAVDIISKSQLEIGDSEDHAIQICDIVKVAARAKIKRIAISSKASGVIFYSPFFRPLFYLS